MAEKKSHVLHHNLQNEDAVPATALALERRRNEVVDEAGPVLGPLLLEDLHQDDVPLVEQIFVVLDRLHRARVLRGESELHSAYGHHL